MMYAVLWQPMYLYEIAPESDRAVQALNKI